MDYFSILNLNKEPFSNSPDPEYFFQSRQHYGCLQKIELSLRLRRGLNVVIGDVGAGKTTLCRQLIRRFAGDEGSETYLILDPSFKSASELLTTIAEMFEGEKIPDGADEFQVKEVIKRYIFRKGVDEKKTVILIIDEGQKIPDFCLEVLREFLNYETNEYKLLQIVIFAQREFENTLKTHPNFADRINLYHFLGPLGFKDTRMMIQFRVNQSSETGRDLAIFSYSALWAIYRATEGYPRKIINLCHQCMLAMIIQNRRTIGWFLVRSCVRRSVYQEPRRLRRFVAVVLVGILAAVFTFGITSGSLEIPVEWKAVVQKMAGIQNPLPEKSTPVFQIQRDTGTDQVNDIPMDSQSTETALSEPVQEAALSLVIEDGDEEDFDAPEPLPEPKEIGSNDTTPKENIEPAADESESLPPQSYSLPSMLGRVTLKQNETLWRLVEKVYGIYSDQRLESLLQENSRIANPDHTEVGQVISVPAIPTEVKPLKAEVWWVKVGEKDTLNSAIDTLRFHPENAPPIRIIPHWNRRQGLKFAILLKAHYFDEVSANNQLSRLMPFVATEGAILSYWNEDTVFFSDPYLK
ncbi:MAG: AAA family ATPase [Deltaproteobacteria bacterium]|nr:AAA family ATPase [Deltaproteobacteria bacterium]